MSSVRVSVMTSRGAVMTLRGVLMTSRGGLMTSRDVVRNVNVYLLSAKTLIYQIYII